MHEGHRQRMRERFLTESIDDFQPHEVLEMMLYAVQPRGDVNPLAHRLLATFGTLRGVLEAQVEQLLQVEGVGEETAYFIAMMVPLFRRYEGCLCEKGVRFAHMREVAHYCQRLLTGLRSEHLYIICLNSQMRVISSVLLTEGSLSEVQAYPRTVVETALKCNAHSVVLCHNHPGGSSTPSQRDLLVTQSIRRALNALGVRLLDHLIVSDTATYSMVQHGDLAAWDDMPGASGLMQQGPWPEDEA